MKHAINCKFCHRPVTVSVDDDYAALGDPYKLLPLAACNYCADLRVERTRLETAVDRVARNLLLIGNKTDARDRCEFLLKNLTRRYSELIARWHFRDKEAAVWDAAIVPAILANPRQVLPILNRLWPMFRQAKDQPD